MSGKSIFIIIFVMWAGFVYADNNILVNPGLERGREGWFDRTCAIEAVASPVHNGTGSVKVIQRLVNWQGIKQSVFGKMVPGKTYKASGWVRLDNAKSDTVAISFEQQDDSGTKYIGVARSAVTDSTWTQLSGEFTLNVTGNLSVLDVYFEGPKPGVNFYVDDVVVYGPEVDAPVVVPAQPTGKGLVNVKIRHQKIEGLGASIAYYTKNLVTHQKKNELYKLLFKDLGLDILRIRNNYDMEPESFNETVEIAKEGEAALGQNLKILISSWSPPTYLKSNDNVVGGTLKQKDGKFMYDEFAQWWCNSLKAYAQAGLKIDYINMQNEVDYEPPWQGCQFAPSETSNPNLAAYNIAFETLWHKLHRELGTDMPKMLAPESSGLGNSANYLANLDSLSHVYGYAHHLYDCSGCGSAPDRFIPRMITYKKLDEQYGNKPIFQTEFEDEPGTWADAINTALVIHNSLTVEHVSAYLYWDLFWATGSGLVSLDDASSYTVKPTYYTYKNFTAFTDANWQRVEASTDNTGMRISAFISPDNKKLTAVIINTSPDVDVSLDLSIKNFKVKKGEVYRSSQSENCVLVDKYNGKSTLKFPANSVTTLALSAVKELK
jgi:glucuronoarabinoxylan endo-1,4-beta-xylanase